MPTLALILLDGSEPLSQEDSSLLSSDQAVHSILVVNKCDLPRKLSPTHLEGACPSHSDIVDISATTQMGLDALRGAIRKRVLTGGVESPDGVMVTNLRHADACQRALLGVEQAQHSVAADRAGELIALDLRIATDALGEITGTITTDEILERIFSEFCIGK